MSKFIINVFIHPLQGPDLSAKTKYISPSTLGYFETPIISIVVVLWSALYITVTLELTVLTRWVMRTLFTVYNVNAVFCVCSVKAVSGV